MNVVTCTRVADGSSDRVLIPILQRLLDTHCPRPTRLNFALGLAPSSRTLADRITSTLNLYPCDYLFVHRDAERESADDRRGEIESAWALQSRSGALMTVVPVRMTEAWLLLDEVAIRAAAGNPNGRISAGQPAASRIKQLTNPKQILFEVLCRVSALPTSRLRRFDAGARRHGVAELMEGLALLRQLPSFSRLEAQVAQAFTV